MKRTLQYSISLLLAGVFLYWAFAGIDFYELKKTLLGVSWPWLLAVVLITCSTLVIRAWRWLVFIRPFAPQVGLRDATLALAICYAANAVVPRSGEALRALSLKWSAGAPFAPLFGTVVVERVLDMIWLVILVGLSFSLLHQRLDEAFPWLGAAALWTSVACGCFVLALIAAILMRQRAVVLVSRLLNPVSPALSTWVSDLLTTFLDTLYALRTFSAYSAIALSSVLLNLGYGAMIYCAFFAFGLQESYGLGLEATLAVLAISSLGMVVPTPGGTGTYQVF